MRAIVTTNPDILAKDYAGYVKVKSISELKGLDVTEVVLNTFTETALEAGLGIAEIQKKGISRVAYVAEDFVPGVQVAVNGLGGICTRDMFYFDSSEELDTLFEEYVLAASPHEEAISENLVILQDFISNFVQNGGDVSEFQVTRATNAIMQLKQDTESQLQDMRNVSNNALEVFREANAYLGALASQTRLLQEQLSALEQPRQSPRASFGGGLGGGGGASFFPSVQLDGSVFNVSKVLFVREFSPCRYLTSFLFAYRYYLQYVKHKRAKLVYVVNRGQGVSKKYDFAAMIDSTSMKSADIYSRDVIAINQPSATAIKRLFSRDGGSAEIIIVVDRLYSGQDIISANSQQFHKLCAVSGQSDLKRFGVMPRQAILTTVGTGNEFILIPHIESYPPDLERRLATYSRICTGSSKDKNATDIFIKLNRVLGLE